MTNDSLLNLPRSRFRAAMILAVTVDALQILAFPLFAEGALSPLDDALDIVTAVVLGVYSVGSGSSSHHSRLNWCRGST